MDKLERLIAEVGATEQSLAKNFRRIAERQAAEHDVAATCESLANECDAHLAWLHSLADPPGIVGLPSTKAKSQPPIGAALRQTSRVLGRHPEAGMLLLTDLRTLYIGAREVEIAWIALIQALKAGGRTADAEEAAKRHQQSEAQAKWAKTRLKVAVPQVIAIPTS